MDAIEMDPQVRAARTWDGQAKAAQARSPFRARFTAMVEEAVLIGVKWLIVSIIALFGVGWFLSDYAAIREQARYVAQVRLAQAQAQQQTAPQAAPQRREPTP